MRIGIVFIESGYVGWVDGGLFQHTERFNICVNVINSVLFYFTKE